MAEPVVALAELDEVEEEEERFYPTTLEQENQKPITNVNNAISFIAANGWYMVGFLLLGYVAWAWFKPKIKRWLEKREEEREASMHHKNPDILLAKHKSIDQVRQRMQEQYNITASIKLAEMKKREEKKREDKVKKLEGIGPSLKSQDKNRASISTSSSNTSSGAKRKSATKPRLRPEYNPLTGDTGASSCRWRPSSQGASGGG